MEQQVNIASRTRSVAFCGLSIALMAVSAWIVVPFGPVPFTLQTFVMVFVLLALRPADALASIAIYLGMGAVGLPLFSAMRGGIGVLAGPTGGFLWGFLLGAVVALAFLKIVDQGKNSAHPSATMRPLAFDAVAAVLFLVVCYICGWLQLSVVAGMGPEAAFLAGVAPFIIIDLVKLAFAVVVARAVRSAVTR